MLNLYRLKNNQEQTDEDTTASPIKKNKKVNVSQYVNPGENLGTSSLKLGLFYTKHKLLLHRLLVWLLILFIIIIWVISLRRWVFFLLYIPEQKIIEQQLTSSINYSNVKMRYGAQPLQAVGTQIINSGVNKYDAIAVVTNPNDRFLVKFEYYFDFGNFKTKSQTAFLLPRQTYPVASLGIDSGSSLGVPNLVIKNKDWQRISNHQVKDTKSWQSYRLNFKTSDLDFIRANSSGKDGANTHIIKFKLTNNSPFNYKPVNFYVGLYQGGSFVGLLPLQIESSFKSLETKQIDLRSFVSSLAIDRVRVFPLLNVYDKEVYLEPKK